jgi:hypothetical protein
LLGAGAVGIGGFKSLFGHFRKSISAKKVAHFLSLRGVGDCNPRAFGTGHANKTFAFNFAAENSSGSPRIK